MLNNNITYLQESSTLWFLQYPFAALTKSIAITLLHFYIFLNYFTLTKHTSFESASQCVSKITKLQPYYILLFTIVITTSFYLWSRWDVNWSASGHPLCWPHLKYSPTCQTISLQNCTLFHKPHQGDDTRPPFPHHSNIYCPYVTLDQLTAIALNIFLFFISFL